MKKADEKTVKKPTKAARENSFERGISASKEFHHHERNLMQYSISVMLLADRKYCLSLTVVKNMYGKGQLAKKDAPNGQSMFIALATAIKSFQRKEKWERREKISANLRTKW